MNKKPTSGKYQTKPKHRWSMLAPENIELGMPYAYSLNLKDECETLKEEYQHYLYIISLMLKPYAEFNLFFELSCIGKLHVHGQIIFHNYQDIGLFYFKFGKLKHRFSCELDTIENLSVWQDYCTKQKNIQISGFLPNNGEICNKDMTEKQYLSPKIRENVEDNIFESTHLYD